MCDSPSNPTAGGAQRGTIHGAEQAGVYVRSPKDATVKALHQAAAQMENQARGARRLALLVAAMPEHDTELFDVLGMLLRQVPLR